MTVWVLEFREALLKRGSGSFLKCRRRIRTDEPKQKLREVRIEHKQRTEQIGSEEVIAAYALVSGGFIQALTPEHLEQSILFGFGM
jgi:hypothetical protein